MTKQIEALNQLIECARLLGTTQSKKCAGTYTQEDSRFEVAMYEAITKHSATVKEALVKPEPLEGLKLIHKADIDLAKKRALEAMQAQPEQHSVSEHLEPVAWAPHLSDRADGVSGHYAIARWNPRGYREVWNLRRHAWGAYSDDVLSLEEADTLLRLIEIPTRRVESPQPAQLEPVAVVEELPTGEGNPPFKFADLRNVPTGARLYTTPPQRTWKEEKPVVKESLPTDAFKEKNA